MCAGLRRQASIRELRSLFCDLCYQLSVSASGHEGMSQRGRCSCTALCCVVQAWRGFPCAHKRQYRCQRSCEPEGAREHGRDYSEPSEHAFHQHSRSTSEAQLDSKNVEIEQIKAGFALSAGYPSFMVHRLVQRQLLSDWRSGRKRCPELTSLCYVCYAPACLEPFKTYLA